VLFFDKYGKELVLNDWTLILKKTIWLEYIRNDSNSNLGYLRTCFNDRFCWFSFMSSVII
jgi:hypothetical protein